MKSTLLNLLLLLLLVPAATAAGEGRFGGDILWYGVDEDRTNPESLAAFSGTFEALGMELARFDVYWHVLEPAPGVYDWTTTDDLVASVPEGADILFTVYASSPWGTKYTDCKAQAAMTDAWPVSSPPTAMGDYVAFLQQLVGRYHLRVKYWQVENEVYTPPRTLPDCPPANRWWMGTKEEYAEHVRTFAGTVKSVDPGLVTLPAGVAFPVPLVQPTDTGFLDHVLSATADLIDAVDLHLYGCVETVPMRVSRFREKLAGLSLDIPLFATESGDIDILCPTVPSSFLLQDSPEERALQSMDMVKRYVLSFASGVEKVFALRLTSTGHVPEGRWSRMGFTFDPQGLIPKPAFYAYQQMAAFLNGFTGVRHIPGGGIHVYGFRFAGQAPVGVAWADAPGTLDLSAYVPVSTVLVTPIVTELDAVDAPIYPLESIVPVTAVPVSEVPVFLSIEP